MKTYSERFNKYFQQNKHMLFCCMLYTFIIGLIAHGYMYFQGTFTHDSLNEFNAAIFGNFWKLQLGRFLVPVYRFFISGDILLPYFSGLLSLLWISLAVFVVVKLFNIQSKKIVALICGIFTVNTTVIALNATFMHDLDADLFALFLSVCATYFWNKNSIKYNILSVIGIVLVLGIYQAYISTTITLMIICLLLSLLKKDQALNQTYHEFLKTQQ